MKNWSKANSAKPLYWILVSIIMIIGNISIVKMDTSWRVWLWIGLFLGMLIIESITMDLTTVWFSVGALAAYVISLTGISFMSQLVVFNIVSLGLLLFARPAAVRKINNNVVKTNVDAIIGEEVIVLEEINLSQGTGMVMLNGIEWTARAVHKEEIIPAGSMVKVEEISGVKVMVTKS